MKPRRKTPGPSPITTKAPGEFPMRINKYLSWKGYSTRRGADELISRRQVTINNRLAVLGDQVNASDTVLVRSNKKAFSYIYYAYNKPRGIATEENRKGSPSISQSVPQLFSKGAFPVGSLDPEAEGLILLTNDRRIIERLLNPSHDHEKTYLVHSIDPLRSNFKEKMEQGVRIGDGKPIKCKVNVIGQDRFNLKIAGNDSHIRQMCSMFFTEIALLRRTAILNIELGDLAPNQSREIKEKELEAFLGTLGLAQ